MSFDWALPPANTIPERESLFREYLKELDIRAKLNADYAAAMANRHATEDLKLPPPVANVQSREETEDFRRYNFMEFRDNLETIMQPKEADKVMTSFTPGPDDQKVADINDRWSAISGELGRIDHAELTASQFMFFINNLFQVERQLGHQLDPSNKPDKMALASIYMKTLDVDKNEPVSRKRTRRAIFGSGVSANNSPRYMHFGKYALHTDSLKKHVLNVKYKKTLAGVPFIPRQIISKQLADLLTETCRTEKFNHELFEQLSEKDQDLFKRLAKQSSFDETIGCSINTKDETAMEDRFELLRGSVMAGNNSPEALRELKSIILQFMANGKIKRTDGNSLLAELSILV